MLNLMIGGLAACWMGCGPMETVPDIRSASAAGDKIAEAEENASPPIVRAARRQIEETTIYDPAYVRLKYPGGDVPRERGVCTDVVIRALREGAGMDLQKLVHEDMSRAFNQYPAIWGLKKPDPNIDHRRVPNLIAFFERQGFTVGGGKDKANYLPGDVVTCLVGNRPHIMVVSDKTAEDGTLQVIHNIGSGVKEEAALLSFKLTGHFRVKKDGFNVP
ncbi:MAG: hypothetical protein CMO66_07380 [Verrucomicrobiales bacterium]|nr:hypothetical protein [Verrucomicrobiales bacterium]